MKAYNPVLYPFQSKWIDIGGNHIHYIDEGKGETILFFHPPIASSFMYRKMIKFLLPHHRCIALDFPGFGLSIPVPGFQPTIQSLADVSESFIEKLHLKNFYFVMQEIGGHAALSAMMKQPENLKGIILTDALVFPVSQYPKIAKMLNIVNGALFNFINTNFNFLIRVSTRFGFGQQKLSSEERQTYIDMFDTREKRRRTTRLLYELVTQENLLEKIQAAFETTFNNKPTLLIYGEKDSLTKLQVPQRIKTISKNAELYFIEGEGHFPHEGAPEEMSILIKDWIPQSEGEKLISPLKSIGQRIEP
jgi:haloalkane dehalogenase